MVIKLKSKYIFISKALAAVSGLIALIVLLNTSRYSSEINKITVNNINAPINFSSDQLNFNNNLNNTLFDDNITINKYINSNAVVARSAPSDEASSMLVFDYADEVVVTGNDVQQSFGWSKIVVSGQELYIRSDYLSDEMLFWDAQGTFFANQNAPCYSSTRPDAVEYKMPSNYKVELLAQNNTWSEVQSEEGTFYIENSYLSSTKVPDHITAINYNYIEDHSYDPVIEKAYALLGTPYGHGYNDYLTDCVGLTLLCYNEVGISLPWSMEQAYCGTAVSYENISAGDIIVWSPFGASYPSHVGIYVGDGLMIHASSTRGVIVYPVADYIKYGGNMIGIRHISLD